MSFQYESSPFGLQQSVSMMSEEPAFSLLPADDTWLPEFSNHQLSQLVLSPVHTSLGFDDASLKPCEWYQQIDQYTYPTVQYDTLPESTSADWSVSTSSPSGDQRLEQLVSTLGDRLDKVEKLVQNLVNSTLLSE